MEIRYNVTGEKRKEMVDIVSSIVRIAPVYMRMPTCNYVINNLIVTKDGVLVYDERTDSETLKNVMEGLANAGFEAEMLATVEAEPSEEADEAETADNPTKMGIAEQREDVGLVVALPRETFTDDSLERLQKLISAKGNLIKKALAVDSLPIEVDEEKISFPWLSEVQDGETASAYTHFITALCNMAKSQKRITAKEKSIDNEKYAFRCFLLRLGFIGSKYKKERKILMSRLEGNSAFKNGTKKEESVNDIPK